MISSLSERGYCNFYSRKRSNNRSMNLSFFTPNRVRTFLKFCMDKGWVQFYWCDLLKSCLLLESFSIFYRFCRSWDRSGIPRRTSGRNPDSCNVWLSIIMLNNCFIIWILNHFRTFLFWFFILSTSYTSITKLQYSVSDSTINKSL